MRKFIALLALLLASTFIFTACNPIEGSKGDVSPGETASIGEGDANTTNTAYQIYEEISKVMGGGSSLDMDMEMEITSSSDPTQAIKMSGKMLQVIRSETDMDMFMDMNVEIMGQQIENKSYFKDGYSYTETSGQKMKMKMDLDEYLKQNGNEFLHFEKEAVKNANITENEDGKVLSFVLDGEKLNELLSDSFGALGEISGAIGDTDVNFDNINMEFGVDNNNTLKYYNMVMTMATEAESGNQEITVTMKSTINKIGDVTIDFPEDLDDYQDVDLGDLGLDGLE